MEDVLLIKLYFIYILSFSYFETLVLGVCFFKVDLNIIA